MRGCLWWFYGGRVRSSRSKFIHSGGIDSVDPALVQEDTEDYVISEAADAVEQWHADDEGEQIVNECVQGLVGEHTPWQVGNRLEFVVDEELRRHHYKAKGKQEAV